MGMKARTKTTIFEESARTILTNALTIAKVNGYRIVQEGCGLCDVKRKGKTACVLCSLLLFRNVDFGKAQRQGVELTVAKILNLPEKWVIDMVTGFDNDGADVTYRSAKTIGRQLWRGAQ